MAAASAIRRAARQRPRVDPSAQQQVVERPIDWRQLGQQPRSQMPEQIAKIGKRAADFRARGIDAGADCGSAYRIGFGLVAVGIEQGHHALLQAHQLCAAMLGEFAGQLGERDRELELIVIDEANPGGGQVARLFEVARTALDQAVEMICRALPKRRKRVGLPQTCIACKRSKALAKEVTAFAEDRCRGRNRGVRHHVLSRSGTGGASLHHFRIALATAERRRGAVRPSNSLPAGLTDAQNCCSSSAIAPGAPWQTVCASPPACASTWSA